MSESKNNETSGNTHSEPRIITRGLFAFSNLKEWILDIVKIILKPRITTFREASTHADNKQIISIFGMIFISAIQYFVYWSHRPTNYLTPRNIIVVLIWNPFTTLAIVTILVLLFQKGFLYYALSYKTIIYITSIVYTISTILMTLSFWISTTLPQSTNKATPEYSGMLLIYLFITLFGLLFTIYLYFICARALIPVEYWSKSTFVIYWTLAILLAYWISQLISRYSINTLNLDQWYLNLGLPLIIYGTILGIGQSIALRTTQISMKKWLMATVMGSLIGAILYSVMLKISLQDVMINWRTQLENTILLLRLLPDTDAPIQLRHAVGVYLNIIERGSFIIPIAIAQWMVIRKRIKYAYFWIGTVLLCEELYFIRSSDTLFLFVRWVFPGVMMAFLLTRLNRELITRQK